MAIGKVVGAHPCLALAERRQKQIAAQFNRVGIARTNCRAEFLSVTRAVDPASIQAAVFPRNEAAHEFQSAQGAPAFRRIGIAFIARRDGIRIGVAAAEPVQTSADFFAASINLDAAVAIFSKPQAGDILLRHGHGRHGSGGQSSSRSPRNNCQHEQADIWNLLQHKHVTQSNYSLIWPQYGLITRFVSQQADFSSR